MLPKIDVVILCGGSGTRVRSLSEDTPKALLQLDNKTFLERLIFRLKDVRFNRVILCTGYQGDLIREYCEKNITGIDIEISHEEKPLGTGGALKNAKDLICGDDFFLMNGDVLCDLNFSEFYKFYKKKETKLALAVCKIDKNEDFGSISLDSDMRILTFREKEKQASGEFSSAGVYIMNKDVFNFMPEKDKFSLEYDFFPMMIKKPSYAYVIKGDFLDIGTPENFKNAEDWIKKHREY